MSEIVDKLKQVSVRRLNLMLQNILAAAESGDIPNFDGMITVGQNKDDVLFAFVTNMNNHFDELMGKEVEKPEAVYNFETLSLVQDDDLDLMVALEGMVGASRNAHLPTFISFNTRLGEVVSGQRIDESSNPLDPSQIADAFKEAILPLGLSAKNTLALFRYFNAEVLRKLDEVLNEANQLLIEFGIIPKMGLDGGKKQAPASRSMPRSRETATGFGTVEEEHYQEPPRNNPEMFSMMQNLLHPQQQAPQGGGGGGTPAPDAGGPAPAGAGGQQYAIPASMVEQGGGGAPMQPFQPAPGEEVQMVDQQQLMSILTNIQKTLGERAGTAKGDSDEADKLDISETLGEMLSEGQEDGKVSAIDAQSSDVINLVTMLYEAIWDDDSVPIPIKELIGRTQITIIKVALSDQTFFNDESHPARMVLNEFADAGIGWTEVEQLEEDPLYKEIQDLVNRILTEYDGEIEFFENILKEFRGFRAKEAAKTRVLEQRIMRAKEREERLEDIQELVTQRIHERMLGRELHPFVEELLDDQFHKFMVMLVLKEGPGTNAWKQAINTIDVLLWTVQPHEHEGDRARLATVNPRLLNNLRKAFRIAKVEADGIDQLLNRLQEVQQESFTTSAHGEAKAADSEDGEQQEVSNTKANFDTPQDSADAAIEFPADDAKDDIAEDDELSDDDPELQQVDSLHVGVWVEFSGGDAGAIRCKLAARISAIDKYIFVNRQGVKVVEKTRMGLAHELKDGTVKIISDGLLFSRALESVIGNLREKQHEQQTGGAYQPGREQGAPA